VLKFLLSVKNVVITTKDLQERKNAIVWNDGGKGNKKYINSN
jgi:hypothetical protein